MPLASIKKIDNLVPHTNADTLCIATIGGWNVITKKGEFEIGDLCAYIEIDSVVPPKPEFEFLQQRRYRVRTIKLRGELSQGLALPLWYLPKGEYELDQDVTDLMEITKFERKLHASLMGFAKGNFPSFLIKTDEPRVQSHMYLLKALIGKPFYITTKLDGTSGTFYCNDGEYGVCSRNLELKEGIGVHWVVSDKYHLDEKLKAWYNQNGQSICIQGEITGPNIQGNPLMRHVPELNVFNAYDIKTKRYLDFHEMQHICEFLEVPMVPVELVGQSFNYDLPALLGLADGWYNDKNRKEGIVIRPLTEQAVRNGRLSFKVINNVLLLEEK